MDDINFPRGGRQPATLAIRKREFNQIFARNSKKNKKRKTKSKDAPVSKPSFLDELLKPQKEFRKESARKLSFEMLREGMLVLGAVKDVQDYRLTISLPGRVFCHVPITNISAPYTKMLNLIALGEEKDCYPLKDMFHVGQHVVARVVSLEPTSHSAVLSLCPREFHRDWLHTDVTASSVVLAAVQSDEEKVYAMDVGIDKVRAVLPKSAARSYEVACNGGRPLGVGQVMRCIVTHHSSDTSATTLQLSADPGQVLAHECDPRHMSLNTVVPGSRFQVTVTRSVIDGWKLRVGSKWAALVYQEHICPGLELTVGSIHPARLLYVLEPFKTVYMSLLPGICSPEQPCNPFLSFKLGAKMRKAKVEAVSGTGLLMTLRSKFRGFVSAKRALEDSTSDQEEASSASVTARLLKRYQPGAIHPCCILDYNYMDQVYICTTEPEVLKAKYLFPCDLTPGQRVTCCITKMEARGALVTVEEEGCPSTKPLRGFVPVRHLTDVPLTQPGKKYQPGTHWTARVLSTTKDQGLRLTLKPSLLSSTLPPLASYTQARVGDPHDGTVVMTSPRGLLVLFYAQVKGFLPLHGLPVGHDPQRDYHEGKTVRVYVSRVLPEQQNMSLTLLPPPEEQLPQKHDLDPEQPLAGLQKSKKLPGKQPVGHPKPNPVLEEPLNGHSKSQLILGQPLNGLNVAKPFQERSVKVHKKSKPVLEQNVKVLKKSKPILEQSVEALTKSKPVPEQNVKALKKSDPVLEEPIKGHKKSKVVPDPDLFLEPPLIKEEVFSDDDRPESQSSSVEFVPPGIPSRDPHPSPEQPEPSPAEIKTEPEDEAPTRWKNTCPNGIPECVEVRSESEDESAVNRRKEKQKKKKKRKQSRVDSEQGDDKCVEESEGVTSGTESSTMQSSSKRKKKKKKRKAEDNILEDSVPPVKKVKKSRWRGEVEFKMNVEQPIKLDPEEKPRLTLKAGFVWDANPEYFSALTASHTRGDSSDDEPQEPAPKRQTPAERRETARAEEQRLRALETASGEVPHTADDFDRLVMSMPNCSLHWTRYMAHHLGGTEVDKARAVGRKALQTISFREDQERLNVWLAMLNLENLYGSPESLDVILKEAVQMNEPVKVYTEVLDMFAATGKSQDAAKLTAVITKKHRDQPGLWVGACRALLRLGEVEKARALLPRALKSLHNKLHVHLITKFAQLEQQWGDPTRGQTLLEQVLTSYPRRVDVWNVYVDMLVKHGSLEMARQVLDRAVVQKLGSHKMKALYKKYLAFEEQHGTPQDVAKVRQMALEYVEGLTKIPGFRKT